MMGAQILHVCMYTYIYVQYVSMEVLSIALIWSNYVSTSIICIYTYVRTYVRIYE